MPQTLPKKKKIVGGQYPHFVEWELKFIEISEHV